MRKFFGYIFLFLFSLGFGVTSVLAEDKYYVSVELKSFSNSSSIIKGDFDKNGKIDLDDIINEIRIFLSIVIPSESDSLIADVNGDNKIDLDDIIYLIRVFLNIEGTSSEVFNYFKDYDFMLVQNNFDGDINSYQELLNGFYNAMNNGLDEFSFTCNSEYSNCMNDTLALFNSNNILSAVNDYVSPFNSYSHVGASYNGLGEFNITFTKLYNEDEIKKVESEVNKIIKNNITNDMSDRDKIKVIHDYIVNLVTYDMPYVNGDTTHRANKAYGALLEGYAVCSGYTDAMAIFLDRFGIENFKVASYDHIWNAVKLDGNWYHLDVTWDDPVVNGDSSIQVLRYDYYLITDEKLEELNNEDENREHTFNRDYYLEFARN